jgi:FKBP-type peptidyl-prolyl cis-trans isomerase
MVMQTFQMRMMEKSGHSQPPQADPEIRAKGEAWLAANATREGVVTTASGLQYKVLEKGKGKSPLLQDQVTVHYEGHKIDGTSFDSSYDRGEPATFPLSNVIRGWQEGLQLMKPGAKYELYIPSGLAYGPQGMPPTIAPDEVLLFTVELISIQAAPPQPKTPNPRSPGQ